ncbi:hypothetical protein GFH48_01165 [Streptomyces fagopyri]|uniref:Uncharacterized protein n=1 Tax=Streptomyces fagopyri TaxID=2662397 RepID=A0A5Q0L4W8_9ACTN|nr:hypothetical protein GFH48_01165 [Streptomyces fagopyri]
MTSNEPPQPLEVTFLLRAAQLLPGDPQVDDYGPLYAAESRGNARAMGVGLIGRHLRAWSTAP